MTAAEDADYKKAKAILDKLRMLRSSPCKKWRGTGHFDVPAETMRKLVVDNEAEMRKDSGHSPTLWRPL